MRVSIPSHSLLKCMNKNLAISLPWLTVSAILIVLLSQCNNARMPVDAGYNTDSGIPWEQIPDSLFYHSSNNADSAIKLAAGSYTVRPVPWYFEEGTRRYYFNDHLDTIKQLLFRKALEGEIATFHTPELKEQWKPEALRDTISGKTVVQFRPYPVERPNYIRDSVIDYTVEPEKITSFSVAEHWDKGKPGFLKPRVRKLSPKLVIPKKVEGEVTVHTWMSWKAIQNNLPPDQADWLKRYLLFNLTNSISLEKDEFTVNLSEISDNVLNNTAKKKIRHFKDYYSVRPIEWHFKDRSQSNKPNFHERLRGINKMLYQKALSGELQAYHTPNFEKKWDTSALFNHVNEENPSSYRPKPVERPNYQRDTVYINQISHDEVNQYRVAEKWHKVTESHFRPTLVGLGPLFESRKYAWDKQNCIWFKWETLKAVLPGKDLEIIRKYVVLTLKGKN